MRNKTHTHVIPELVAYLDGELSERDQSRIAAALCGSSDLQQETARLERVGSLIAHLEKIAPSSNFADTFWQRLEHEGQIEEESSIARWQRQWTEWQTEFKTWFIAGEGWKEWLAGGHWTPAFVPVVSLLIILGSLFSGTLLTSGPSIGPSVSNQQNQKDQIPTQVVENPAFFRDYWRTVRLERWAHFDEIAKVQAPARPSIDLTPENVPPKVIEDPNFFIQYPILRRMEQFQYFESVQKTSDISDISDISSGQASQLQS